VVSAQKYLDYGDSVSAGFMLSPAPIQTCDISSAGSCAPAPMLTIGLTSAMKAGFSTVPLRRDSPMATSARIQILWQRLSTRILAARP
jgi:hypothetical protein